MTVAITMSALFALLIFGVPIAISLLASGMVAYMLVIGFDPGMNALGQTVYDVLDSFVIIAIPLYILMGQIMLKGGAGKDLFDLAQRIVGKLPGGLAIAAIVASAIFAAISGSSTATAATIGSISIPEMLERGYDRKMAAGAVAMAGTLGILIPPSIAFILYSLVTETSVDKLFMAGILPGILLTVLFSVYTIFAARRQIRLGIAKPLTSRSDIRINRDVIGGLLLIPIVLGSIYMGWFTATEAAAAGVVYSLVLTTVVKRTMNWSSFWFAVRDSVVTSAMILVLIAGAGVFGNAMSLLRVPQDLAEWLQGMHLSAWEFLIAVNILYLVLGMFMDATAAILITVPILLPGLQAQNIDLIWFGVILVINMEIGAVTPPVGLNLFVVQALRPDYTITEVLMGALPYVVMGLIGLALVMIFPQIALLLPNWR